MFKIRAVSIFLENLAASIYSSHKIIYSSQTSEPFQRKSLNKKTDGRKELMLSDPPSYFAVINSVKEWYSWQKVFPLNWREKLRYNLFYQYIQDWHFYFDQSLISFLKTARELASIKRTWDKFPNFQVPEQLLLLIQNTTQEKIYIFKVNNANTRKRCEICSKVTIKTLDRLHWRRSDIFVVKFGDISYLLLIFVLLTLNMFSITGSI